MTEGEWRTSVNLAGLVVAIQYGRGLTMRKARLFCSAVCRRIWHLMPTDLRRETVEVAERYADGQASEKEFERIRNRSKGVMHYEAHASGPRAASLASWQAVSKQAYYSSTNAGMAALLAVQHASRTDEGQEAILAAERAAQAALFRDIVGPSPSRLPGPVPATVLSWNDGTARRLATEAYEARSLPSGHLDPLPLGVLADALEEAGAADEVVAHLRTPGPHVRGCWALDLVLGKE